MLTRKTEGWLDRTSETKVAYIGLANKIKGPPNTMDYFVFGCRQGD